MAIGDDGLMYLISEDGLYIYNGTSVERISKNLKGSRLKHIYNLPKQGVFFEDQLDFVYKIKGKEIELVKDGHLPSQGYLMYNGFFKMKHETDYPRYLNIYRFLVHSANCAIKLSDSVCIYNRFGYFVEQKYAKSRTIFSDSFVHKIESARSYIFLYKNHMVDYDKSNNTYRIYERNYVESLKSIQLRNGLNLGIFRSQLVQLGFPNQYIQSFYIGEQFVVAISSAKGLAFATYRYHQILDTQYPKEVLSNPNEAALSRLELYNNTVDYNQLFNTKNVVYSHLHLSKKGDLFLSINENSKNYLLKYNVYSKKTAKFEWKNVALAGEYFNDKTILYGTHMLMLFDNQSNVKKEYKLPMETNYISYHAKLNQLAISSNQGFYVADTSVKHFKLIESTKGLIIEYAFYDEQIDAYILAVSSIGVMLLDRQGKLIPYTKFNSILNSRVHFILKDKEQNYWISSNAAIYKLQSNAFRELLKDSAYLGDGFIFDAEYFQDVMEFNNYRITNTTLSNKSSFVFPSMQGFVELNLERLSDHLFSKPVIQIETIQGKFQKQDGNYQIEPGYKYISFSANIFYLGPKLFPSLLSYKIEGSEDNTWHDLKPNEPISISGLSHGSYKISVKASVFGHTVYNQLSFDVLPKFYQTTWFKALGVLGILGFLVLFYYVITAYTKRNIQKKSEFLHYQSTSLKGQINSHLLFNIFQSVASNIRMGHQETAYESLISIADYLRSLLNQTESYQHMLEKELSFCQQYLDFMSQIYPGRFNYSIESHSDEPLEIMTIPSIIIQPFLENAIIHGFKKPQEHDYLLQLRYYYKMGYLIIQVEDNGEGMDQKQLIRKSQSKGIHLIEKKIKSYYSSVKLRKKSGIKIRSKNAGHREETGVLVSLFLPLDI